MEICEYNSCTGCAACAAVCPQHCIIMKEDDFGELHPVIQKEKCIGCSLCSKVCHNHHEFCYDYPKKCYAAWMKNKEKRCRCASGGAASIVSEYFIKYKKGIVFGTAYDEKLMPYTTCTHTVEGLEKFKGSKYVQSMITDAAWKKMKEYIKKGRYVLYIGTPCQIAAAKAYMKKDYDNFYTMDLICHGAVPVKYFREEIRYLINKYRLSDIIDVRFRGNDNNNFKMSLWDNNYVMSMWSRIRGGGKSYQSLSGK